jgi:hypothetical protein
MNIFYLDKNANLAAEYHVDKHCVKMILESAQLLSTAHRVLDGIETTSISNNRKKRIWHLPDEREQILYSATHIHHPSAVWVRQSKANYVWLYNLFVELCKEYTYRYDKVHKCQRELIFLQLARIPENIPDVAFTEPTPAMPDQYKVPGNSVQSYHNYYNGEKQRMFAWKKRNVPTFINKTI